MTQWRSICPAARLPVERGVAALVDGEPATATRLLTRPFAFQGVVVHGDKRGRELGYPTANVALGSYLRPRYGIYAVRVRLDDGSEHDGVANLGIRPMFDPPKELLETVLFDWDGDLYGRTIEVALRHFIRPEKKFDGLDALVDAGAIAAYGVSVETVDEALQAIARPNVASVQVIMNVLRRKPLEQVLPAAAAAGVEVAAANSAGTWPDREGSFISSAIRSGSIAGTAGLSCVTAARAAGDPGASSSSR